MRSLAPYTTQKVQSLFYFPETGTYQQFPSNIAMNDVVVARAPPCELKVVKKRSEIVYTSFRDVLAGGNIRDILKFLRERNLTRNEMGFTFESILWMLKDRKHYDDVISVLRKRAVFNNQVWGFALLHGEERGV